MKYKELFGYIDFVQLAELLLEHSKVSGVPLSLGEEGVCHLLVNGEHVVSVEAGENDNIFCYAHVAMLPDTGNEEVFRALLKANLYGKRTEGLVFALDDIGTEVVLFREFSCATIDFDSYFKSLQDIVSQLVFWKDEIEKTLSAAGIKTTKAPPPSGTAGTWIKI
ncbi:MAG: type III secretion system chaperone [Chlamydiales bacterium]|nr:type III secretion system chaperone [Chlamydiales bacterium]